MNMEKAANTLLITIYQMLQPKLGKFNSVKLSQCENSATVINFQF